MAEKKNTEKGNKGILWGVIFFLTALIYMTIPTYLIFKFWVFLNELVDWEGKPIYTFALLSLFLYIALYAYEKALKLNPCKANYYIIGELHFRTRDYTKSVKIFELIVEMDCSCYDWSKLASIYSLMGQDIRAIKSYNVALKYSLGEFIKKKSIIEKLAVLYIKHSCYDKAFSLLVPFIREHPQATSSPSLSKPHAFTENHSFTPKICL